MSQSFDRKLGLIDRLGLKMHLVICHSCRIVYSQFDLLHRVCQKAAAKPEDVISMQPGLSTEAQERILKELHRKQDG